MYFIVFAFFSIMFELASFYFVSDYTLSQMDYKSTLCKIAKLELEIYKVRTNAEFLLDEIKDVTTSEERNRANITRQKTQYRELYQKFDEYYRRASEIYAGQKKENQSEKC